ncbi:hypothetical protein S7711_11338 [Stachybotrys chartarum IBT 7711]|uniref:Uncharacterized protein n=1 Tax=Stachybotrys chartarum (strain CBS 109288 / IBT 7711) TaxID=1280523 RepID=A0A084AYJ6_STACB|nr:hypothetical protein S7711_11338 [Stachybotrys chartarum IBT 7711]KFA47699.1 hypothetical protein S40293_11286 [Stachybotrys chartarum IBT 40293]KFA77700.1 hypothetical protein S40288_10744 [Stachybotrys chartarum IBT 40288]
MPTTSRAEYAAEGTPKVRGYRGGPEPESALGAELDTFINGYFRPGMDGEELEPEQVAGKPVTVRETERSCLTDYITCAELIRKKYWIEVRGQRPPQPPQPPHDGSLLVLVPAALVPK